MDMKISKKDAKLLLYVCGIAILLLSYFLVYQRLNTGNAELEITNTQLKAQEQQLVILQQKQAEYESDIETMQNNIDDIYAQFPADSLEEDAFMYAVDLESQADMTINAVSVGSKNLLFQSGQAATTDSTTGTEDAATAVGTQTDADTAQLEADAAAINGDSTAGTTSTDAATTVGTTTEAAAQSIEPSVYLFGTTNSLNYTVSYDGWKDIITYIQNDTNKKNVESLSVSYDSESGLLIGTMDLNVFTISGTDKTYEPPYVPNMTLGVDNIFGTLNNSAQASDTESGEPESSEAASDEEE